MRTGAPTMRNETLQFSWPPRSHEYSGRPAPRPPEDDGSSGPAGASGLHERIPWA